jgi:hypothetical protein
MFGLSKKRAMRGADAFVTKVPKHKHLISVVLGAPSFRWALLAELDRLHSQQRRGSGSSFSTSAMKASARSRSRKSSSAFSVCELTTPKKSIARLPRLGLVVLG